ncbi:MAG TPA: hypothetical protein VFV12_08820 [Xanthobacteraceae bacterium]|nr:hypothetical protein [Xanthobacteraceae bacterium]
MIKPTVGRVVWFTPPADRDTRWDKTQPLAAIVAYVWNDRMVNLHVTEQTGSAVAYTSVPLLQGDEAERPPDFFAEWMPYQVGQAARYEAAMAAQGTGMRGIQAGVAGSTTPPPLKDDRPI